jgi:hypothetical protein
LVIDDCIKTDEGNLPLFTYHSGISFMIQAIKNGQIFSKKLWQASSVDTNIFKGQAAAKYSLCLRAVTR